MSNQPTIRFVYHFRPVLAIVVLLAICIISFCSAAYLWLSLQRDPECGEMAGGFALSLLLVSLGSLIGIGFLRSVTLIVDDNNLTVIRRSFIRLFSSYDVYPRDAISCIWYERDILDKSYNLFVCTKDERKVRLIQSESKALPLQMPSKLAEALNLDFVEVLDLHPKVTLAKDRH